MWPFSKKRSAKVKDAAGAPGPVDCQHPYEARVSEYEYVDGVRRLVGVHCELCGKRLEVSVPDPA